MNLKEKMERYAKLEKDIALSDQEYEEMLQLGEEIQMELTEKEPQVIKLPSQPEPKVQERKPIKKQKRSLAEIIYQKLKKKPVTDEQLVNLKREEQKTRLQAKIARNKAATKKYKGERFNALFGSSQKQEKRDYSSITGTNNSEKLKHI